MEIIVIDKEFNERYERKRYYFRRGRFALNGT